MGLVPSNITKKWYYPDPVTGHSAVYKNFIYLFRNPLWNKKRLPTGFPECMLFWASMFSLLLFRPCVAVIQYLIRPLLAVTWLIREPAS